MEDGQQESHEERRPQPSGRHDATQGSLSRVVLALSIPIIAVNLLQVVLGLAELRFLAVLGEGAIDAVVTINQTFRQLFMTTVIAVSWGAAALVAQRMGAREPREAGAIMGQTFGLLIIAGVITAGLGLGAGPAVLRSVGMVPAEHVLALQYVRVTGVVQLVVYLGFAMSAMLQSTGDVRTPLVMTVLSMSLNLLLNWLLIFGIGPFPEWGVVGVAAANGIAGSIALAYAVLQVRRIHRDLELRLRSLWISSWGLFGKIVNNSWPLWVQLMCRFGAIFITIRLLSGYGATARAGYGIALRLDMVVMNFGLAFSMAAATVTGQNVGAQEYGRAARGGVVAWGYFAMLASVFTIVFWAIGPQIVAVFTDDPEVAAVSLSYLRITSAVYPVFAAAFVFSRAQQGAGDMITPMVLTCLGYLLVFIPLAFWLPTYRGLGVHGIFIAQAIGTSVGGVLQATAFLSGRWRARAIRLATV